MNKPAYIVEGDLEQDFLQNVCPGAPVRTIGCNGDSVALTAIAKRVATHVRTLQKRYNPIIVIFDREQRPHSCSEIKRDFLLALGKEEGIEASIVVGIPDRDIEVWILADLEMFQQLAGIESLCDGSSCEGFSGKARIKKLLPQGRFYIETIHGVKWLKCARPLQIKKNSPSFSSFLDGIPGLECWWLQQQL